MSNEYETCSACSGSGMYWAGEDVKPCSECKGNTVVPMTHQAQTAAVKLSGYRAWVLRHFEHYGWNIVVDRIRSKKAERELAMLFKRGLVEQDCEGPFNPSAMFRITDAGRSLLSQTEG